MDSTNFIRHNVYNIQFQPNMDYNEPDQPQVNEIQQRDIDNISPYPCQNWETRLSLDGDHFNFQEAWGKDKDLTVSVQECTSMVVRQEEIPELELSECAQQLQSVHSGNFSAFSPLDERSVESVEDNSQNID